MRADEAITQCRIDFGSYYEKINAEYINKIRYERLMAKARYFNELAFSSAYPPYIEQVSRIADKCKERAMNIKECM